MIDLEMKRPPVQAAFGAAAAIKSRKEKKDEHQLHSCG
jgi:hypothetical protein